MVLDKEYNISKVIEDISQNIIKYINSDSKGISVGNITYNVLHKGHTFSIYDKSHTAPI